MRIFSVDLRVALEQAEGKGQESNDVGRDFASLPAANPSHLQTLITLRSINTTCCCNSGDVTSNNLYQRQIPTIPIPKLH